MMIMEMACEGLLRSQVKSETCCGAAGLSRDQGYTVVVSRVGDTPPDRCVVVSVRVGQTYSHTDHGVPGGDRTTTVTNKTVYVDVKC
ncbi:hypothetical protein [Mycolicibacterium fortuitum]|uniref:hypothetical protein n=1 Tax=Mycolicibacterium fortuitum TaxID=1766 RepID=UPI00103E889B|nr:hypothetical protein [Mycolicibacterium fortuitum]WEV34376.1 hypothetical protein OMF10_08450 [Mycolicibacterium fortuitum]